MDTTKDSIKHTDRNKENLSSKYFSPSPRMRQIFAHSKKGKKSSRILKNGKAHRNPRQQGMRSTRNSTRKRIFSRNQNSPRVQASKTPLNQSHRGANHAQKIVYQRNKKAEIKEAQIGDEIEPGKNCCEVVIDYTRPVLEPTGCVPEEEDPEWGNEEWDHLDPNDMDRREDDIVQFIRAPTAYSGTRWIQTSNGWEKAEE